MDDDTALAGALLSRVAGICEDLASVAALTGSAMDPVAIASLQKDLADAAAMLDAVRVISARRSPASS